MNILIFLCLLVALIIGFFGVRSVFKISDQRWQKTMAEVVANPSLVEDVFLIMPEPTKIANLQMRLTDGRLFYIESGTKAVQLFDAWKRGEKDTLLAYMRRDGTAI